MNLFSIRILLSLHKYQPVSRQTPSSYIYQELSQSNPDLFWFIVLIFNSYSYSFYSFNSQSIKPSFVFRRKIYWILGLGFVLFLFTPLHPSIHSINSVFVMSIWSIYISINLYRRKYYIWKSWILGFAKVLCSSLICKLIWGFGKTSS